MVRRCPVLAVPLLLTALGLTGCPAASVPRPPEPAPEPAPAPGPPDTTKAATGSCLDLGDDTFAVAPLLEAVALDGPRTLTFCRREDAGNACYALDLETGALSGRPVPEGFDTSSWTAPPPPAPLRVNADNTGAEVCPPHGACRRLAITPRGALITDTAVSADGRFAALTLAHDEQTLIQVYSLPSGRATKRLTIPAEPFPCANAEFLGNTLLVMQNICAGPAGYAWLAAPASARRIAWVGGGEDFGASTLWPLPLGGDLWAFREETGVEVVVQNVVDGSIVHRINLSDTHPRSEEGDLLADPTSGMMLRNISNGELVLVHDSASQGRVVRVDPATGKVVKFIMIPRCER